MEQPKFCCCGIKLGLTILHLLVLLGSILCFVSGAGFIASSSTRGSITIIQGVLYLAASVAGLASIKTEKVKVALATLRLYIATIAINIILAIVSLSIMGSESDDVIEQEKIDNPNLSDADLDAIKTRDNTSVIVGNVIAILLTLIIGGLIVHRLNIYKNWLIEKK
eukprot:NODE_70_length_24940_cov_0.663138.p16 type:complete len:166 gc:universal NODE_70_length_24940_cov_0.663138:6199-5702(-)